MEQFQPIQYYPGIDNLDITKPECFKAWSERLGILLSNKISDTNLMLKKEDKIDESGKEANLFKVNNLKQALGPDGCEILKTVQSAMTTDSKNLYDELVKGLENYFEPKKNIFHQRRVFMSRVQEREESIFEYVDAVRKLAQHIEVIDKDDSNTWILSVVVNGLRDRKLAERVQLMEDVSLDKVVSFLINTETVQRQDRTFNKSDREEVTVERVKSQRQRGLRGPNQAFRSRNSINGECDKCGMYHRYDFCPADNQKCLYCEKMGHFIARCPEKKRRSRRVNPVGANDCSDDDQNSYMASSDEEVTEFLGEVSINAVSEDQRWMVQAMISKCDGGKKLLDFKLDTGATVSCLPSRLFRNNCRYIKKPVYKLLTADKNLLKTRGFVTLNLEYDGKKVSEDFYVVENLKTPLLGLTAIESLKILTRLDKNLDGKVRPTREFIGGKVPKIVPRKPDRYEITSRNSYERRLHNPKKPWSFGERVLRGEKTYDNRKKPWSFRESALRGETTDENLSKHVPRRYKFPLHYPPRMFGSPDIWRGGDRA